MKKEGDVFVEMQFDGNSLQYFRSCHFTSPTDVGMSRGMCWSLSLESVATMLSSPQLESAVRFSITVGPMLSSCASPAMIIYYSPGATGIPVTGKSSIYMVLVL